MKKLLLVLVFMFGCTHKFQTYEELNRSLAFKIGDKVKYVGGYYIGCTGVVDQYFVNHGIFSEELEYVVKNNCDGHRTGTTKPELLRKIGR